VTGFSEKRFLKNADFNISDIFLRREEKEIPESFIEFVESQAGLRDSGMLNNLKLNRKITSFISSFFVVFSYECKKLTINSN
jgi:hypothetical protein